MGNMEFKIYSLEYEQSSSFFLKISTKFG